MFDAHYDLLTIAYKAYLNNDYSYLEKISKYFNDNNVKGVIANLYFMTREEMVDEVHKDYYRDDVSVLDMFIKSKEVLDAFLPDTEILYSIEGADYISGPEELEKLYDAGLDSLIICWNTENKYASGNRSDKGLTASGRELIEKAIDLGLGIDLSHANENTFNDLIDLIKEKQDSSIEVTSFVSHSNARCLCDRDRNLYDEQLEKIKSVNGLVGVFANRNFIIDPSGDYDSPEARNLYLFHIDYIKNIVGIDNTIVSTDEMGFLANYDPVYGTRKIYDYSTIANDLRQDLTNNFGIDNAEKMIYSNAKEKIFNKIRENREKKRGNIL